MGKNVFTRDGLAHQRTILGALNKKVRESGQKVGEAAGENCDWHDNFGYDDAKRRLEMDSTRALNLERELAGGQVIDVIEQNVRVRIGNSVKYIIADEEKIVTIGAWGESLPERGLISYQTPLAQALMNHQVGDEINTQVGGGDSTIEVVQIFPPSFRYRDLIQELLNSQPND